MSHCQCQPCGLNLCAFQDLEIANGEMQESILKALEIANKHGEVDGAHHKTWVIDQIVRALLNDPTQYHKWVARHNAGEEGPHTYEWEIGIAP